MRPDLFAQVGELLYGPAWRGVAAFMLKVAPRTIRRWETGVSPIPEGVAGYLATICREKADGLAKMAAKLDETP